LKILPQARLSILILSKAYRLVVCKYQLLSMHGSKVLGFSFCWKATKSNSLISYFSFQYSSSLTILSEHLSLSKHGGKHLTIRQVLS
jgi:hypothetical protein